MLAGVGIGTAGVVTALGHTFMSNYAADHAPPQSYANMEEAGFSAEDIEAVRKLDRERFELRGGIENATEMRVTNERLAFETESARDKVSNTGNAIIMGSIFGAAAFGGFGMAGLARGSTVRQVSAGIGMGLVGAGFGLGVISMINDNWRTSPTYSRNAAFVSG